MTPAFSVFLLLLLLLLLSQGRWVELVAKRPIKSGEVLTMSYGEFTNADLLLDYGFTDVKNPYDR